MLQRIQSLHLLVAFAIVGITLCVDLAGYFNGVNTFRLSAFGLENSYGIRLMKTLQTGLILTFATLIPLVTIFLYRNRRLQMRLCLIEIVLLSVGQALILIDIWRIDRLLDQFGGHSLDLALASLSPLFALLFVYLAYRAVRSDEKLVRSLDRIR